MRVLLLMVGIALGLMVVGCASTPEGKQSQCEAYSALIVALNAVIVDADGEPLVGFQDDVARIGELARDLGCAFMFPDEP